MKECVLFCGGLVLAEQVAPKLKVFFGFPMAVDPLDITATRCVCVCDLFCFVLFFWQSKTVLSKGAKRTTQGLYSHICLKKKSMVIFFLFIFEIMNPKFTRLFMQGERFMTSNAWSLSRTMCIILKNGLASVWIWKSFILSCWSTDFRYTDRWMVMFSSAASGCQNHMYIQIVKNMTF